MWSFRWVWWQTRWPQLFLSTWQQGAGTGPVSFFPTAARQLGAHSVLSHESGRLEARLLGSELLPTLHGEPSSRRHDPTVPEAFTGSSHRAFLTGKKYRLGPQGVLLDQGWPLTLLPGQLSEAWRCARLESQSLHTLALPWPSPGRACRLLTDGGGGVGVRPGIGPG